MYTWGRGSGGQLGHGNSDHCMIPTVVTALVDERIVQCALGADDPHTLALTDKGKVYCWGLSEYSTLGKQI